MSNLNVAAPWNTDSARALYNIHRWGAKYFDINDAGHVVARPLQDAGATVDLTDVIEEAKGRGLKFPLLIRFQDILRHRVEAINKAFQNSIAEFNYQGKYRGVFPIKVNQLREVVEEILDAGKPFEFGLLACGVCFSAEAVIRRCETEVRFRIAWGELHGYLQFRGGARRLVSGDERPAQNHMRGEIVGAGFHGQATVLHGGFGIFAL